MVTKNNIAELLNFKPEVLIIGSGASRLVKVDDKLKEKLKVLGIELVIKRTAEAVFPIKEIVNKNI